MADGQADRWTDECADGPWWGADRGALSRVLADLVHAELRRLRLGAPGGPPPWCWTAETRLDETGPAAVDSLDQLALSAAVAEIVPGCGAGSAALRMDRFGALCDAVAAGGAAHPPRQVGFRSSGSTGPARSTAHPLARLEREAAAFAAIIGPGRRRVLSAVPAHHAYGFIHSMLLPRHLEEGAGGVPVRDLRGHAPSELAEVLMPGDLVLGHPTFWGEVLRGGGARLPPEVVGITSTAPCPDGTATGLREIGLSRLLQVYGASELAGIGWRDDSAQPYALLPGYARDGDGGGLLRDGEAVASPDRLRWVDGARFHVLGRRDGAVQVGGVNVVPELVRDALLRHPSVAEAAVRPMRPEEGSRLKAFVVPTAEASDPDALQAALRRFATEGLAPAERPGAYAFGPALPRTAMGKLTDWAA